MIRSFLAGLALLAFGALAYADNFAFDDAVGNRIVFPCTTVAGVCTPTVTATTVSGQTVDLIKVGGAAFVLGQTTMSKSLPVAIATDQGTLAVGGNAASGAADSGNPVKVGGRYNSTQPTLTNGQRGDLQQDTRGNLKITLVDGDAQSKAWVGPPTDGTTTANVGALYTWSTLAIQSGSGIDVGRAIVNGTNSTGTGILAVGQVAQLDDTTPTTISENQFGNVRMNSVRAQYIEAGPYSYSRKTADGQVKSSAGFIHTICFAPTTATPTAGLITLYDNTAESGTAIYSAWFFATTNAHCDVLDVVAATGLYVGYDGTATNMSVTVSYR